MILLVVKLTRDNNCGFYCFPWGFIVNTGKRLLDRPVRGNLYVILARDVERLTGGKQGGRKALFSGGGSGSFSVSRIIWRRRLGHPASRITLQFKSESLIFPKDYSFCNLVRLVRLEKEKVNACLFLVSVVELLLMFLNWYIVIFGAFAHCYFLWISLFYIIYFIYIIYGMEFISESLVRMDWQK